MKLNKTVLDGCQRSRGLSLLATRAMYTYLGLVAGGQKTREVQHLRCNTREDQRKNYIGAELNVQINIIICLVDRTQQLQTQQYMCFPSYSENR